MTTKSNWYPDNYEQSRDRFRARRQTLARYWSETTLSSLELSPGLEMDMLTASHPHADQVLIITTGLHGIEGIVGSAMLELLLEDFVQGLNHERTALVLVHAINPWGMKHESKTNEHNIDLNRNLVVDWSDRPALSNPDYERMHRLFRPRSHHNIPAIEKLRFLGTMVRELRTSKPVDLTRAVTLGQYGDPQGIYYGGEQAEPATAALQELYERCMREYKQIVLLDMHTGYGPSDRMFLVNSSLEPRGRPELQKKLSYESITETKEGEFYRINGDMIDYLYRLRAARYPDTELFATAFEFGTLGDSILAQIESLHITVQQNDHRHRGRGSKSNIRRRFREMYAPSSAAWRSKAISDCRQAYEGIIRGFEL
ncbi:uncharacterized protein DUF2817 [Paenibacillus taihuensis]|uniref:Uncharacterized protein DUF2817 n=1 Tax=Paenibacillus taihuensis TaxID=1156355 RepID=A0A3D9RWM1_9BACL|nr:M14 family metallopeptidase [Paenibacillus taihuensis]REE83878.1 uncharacterized protein DUF2817 [Paenibacillus taihuensis]